MDVSNELYDAVLKAYVETQKHIEELERISATTGAVVFTMEAKQRADALLERLCEFESPPAGEPPVGADSAVDE